MPILLTLSGRHPHYPSFIHHFKRKTWVDGPYSGVCRPKREQRKMKGLILFWLDEKQKYRRENGKIRWEKKCTPSPSPVSFPLFHFLFFSLSAPWGLGVSCNLSIGFSLAYPVTCSPSYLFLFLLDHFYSISMSLFPCFFAFCLSLSLSLLSLLGFLNLLSACLQHVCDRAAWQEGRQADGHWDLEWLRSGASGAHGECVFPTSVECQRTPIHLLKSQHSSLTKSTSTHWERENAYCLSACV